MRNPSRDPRRPVWVEEKSEGSLDSACFLSLRTSGLVVPVQGINRNGDCQRDNQECVHLYVG